MYYLWVDCNNSGDNMRVQLKKICVSEDGKKTCKHQGTDVCHGCSVYSGQRFRGHDSRPVKFACVPISALLKRLCGGY